MFALTAFAAAEIGHFSPLESFWKAGPSIDVAGQPITLAEEFIKPELQGLAAYGIGEGLGIKDPEALGVGAAAGSFVAPWVMATTDAYFGLTPEGSLTVYQSANPAYAGSVAPTVGSQITGLIGGLAGYGYDGDFSLGQFGATQIYNFNDLIGVGRKSEERKRPVSIVALNPNTGQYVYGQIGDYSDGKVDLLPQYAEQNPDLNGQTLEHLVNVLHDDGAFYNLFGEAPQGTVVSYQRGFYWIPGQQDLDWYYRNPGPYQDTISSPQTAMTAQRNGILYTTPESAVAFEKQFFDGVITSAGDTAGTLVKGGVAAIVGFNSLSLGSAVEETPNPNPGIGPESAVEEDAVISGGPDFIASENGTVFPVPEGATGPGSVANDRGFSFTGGSGGNGLSPSTTGLRLMDPRTTGPYPYPNGYGVYMNFAGRTINPYTGLPIPRNDPWAHIPIE